MEQQAFIIMQIGNPDLDRICQEVIVPVLKSFNLGPKRVDKHNQGDLLKSEIIKFIETSKIIIADLTNERPNCYLEVGYAMGSKKFKNLILTAREDHNIDSPNHKKNGPKIHFDLTGYDILFWEEASLEKFRIELAKRVKRRLEIINKEPSIDLSPWDEEWISNNRKIARTGHAKIGLPGLMEIRFALSGEKPELSQSQLLQAANQAQIHTFGWPIGIVASTPPSNPRSRTDGISAEIAINSTKKGVWLDSTSYDYWYLRKNGDFYLLKTLFEDQEIQKNETRLIFFNTRIIRITETILYCKRLYSYLGIDSSSTVNIAIQHDSLEGRLLASSRSNTRIITGNNGSFENSSETIVSTPLSSIESNLAQLVKKLAAPLLYLFNFYEVSEYDYEKLVTDFVQGKVT